MPKSAEIQDQINKIDADIQAGSSDAQLNVWEMQKSDLKKELETALADEAADNQQQAQAAQIGGLKETMRTIFEAAFPKDETVKLIGLTEYETTQQTYNQLTDQAIDEDQSTLYEAFKSQLEQRDEKFRTLTSQALDVQNQLDKASNSNTVLSEINTSQLEVINNITKDRFEMQKIIDGHDEDMHQKDIEIESLGQQLENAKETIFNLQKQINNVPAATQIIDITPTKPSTSLADKIAQAKIESVKQFSNFYSDVTFKDGTKEVVHNSLLPTLEIPVLPTLDPINVEQGNNVEQVIHPSEDQIPAAIAGLVDSAPSVSREGATSAAEAPVTRAEHEALAARVATIERHANIQAVA